jgi:membrane protein DedA with SNARE-associated domain
MTAATIDEPAVSDSTRRLVLGLAGAMYVTGTIGSNIAPAMIDQRPALVLALSSRNRNLFAAVPYLDVIPWAIIGFVRVFAVGIVLYYVGQWWGGKAMAWTERQMGELPAIYRWIRTGVEKAGWLLVLLMPGSNLVCLMAGHIKMRKQLFVPLLAVGVVLKLVFLRIFGDLFEVQLKAVLDWMDNYQWWFVGGLFLLSFLQSQRRMKSRRTGPTGPLD